MKWLNKETLKQKREEEQWLTKVKRVELKIVIKMTETGDKHRTLMQN